MDNAPDPKESAAMEHREVPAEVLREFARQQVESSSIRLAAQAAGVGRTTMHKFIYAGTTPYPRVRRLLVLWYIRQVAGVEEVEGIHPCKYALRLLLSHVPRRSRHRVAAEMLSILERGYADAGEVTPVWVTMLCTGELDGPRGPDAVDGSGTELREDASRPG